MIYKGRIISVERNYAIVITNEMEYFKIKKKDCLGIGREIMFMNDDIYSNSDNHFSTIARYAASFLIVAFTLSLLFQMNTGFKKTSCAAALVSIDINPSIELSVDSGNRVIDINPINSEGMAIAKEDLIGTDIFESILVVVKTAKNLNYIKSDSGFMLISLASISEESSLDIQNIREGIENRIANDINLKNLNIAYLKVSLNDIKDAQKEKISIGKYEIYRKLNQGGQVIELGALKSMDVKELIEMDSGQIKNSNRDEESNNDSFIYRYKDYQGEYQSYLESMKQRRNQISINSEQNQVKGITRCIKENEQRGPIQEDTPNIEDEGKIENQVYDYDHLEAQENADSSQNTGIHGMVETHNSNSKKDTDHGPEDKGRNNKKIKRQSSN